MLIADCNLWNRGDKLCCYLALHLGFQDLPTSSFDIFAAYLKLGKIEEKKTKGSVNGQIVAAYFELN